MSGTVPKFDGVLQGQWVSKIRCPDCGRVGHYQLTKSPYKLLMHMCHHADLETGTPCHRQSKLSRTKSHALMQQFVDNDYQIIDQTKEYKSREQVRKETREERAPEPQPEIIGEPEPAGPIEPAGSDDLYELYANE